MTRSQCEHGRMNECPICYAEKKKSSTLSSRKTTALAFLLLLLVAVAIPSSNALITERIVNTTFMYSAGANFTSDLNAILVHDTTNIRGTGKNKVGMRISNSISARDALQIVLNTTNNTNSSLDGGVGIYIDNYGSQDQIALFQHGVLAPTEYGIKFSNLIAQPYSELFRISNDQSGQLGSLMKLVNLQGNNHVFVVENTGNRSGILVLQDGVTANTAGLAALGIVNTGNTGRGLDVYTNTGVSATSFVRFRSDNVENDMPTVEIAQDGSGEALYIAGGNITAASSATVFVQGAATSTAPVLRLNAQNASKGLYLVSTGSGIGIDVNQDANASGINVDMTDSTGAGLFISGGPQTSGTQGAIYVLVGAAATSPGFRIDTRNTARGGYIVNTGTGNSLEINNAASTAPGIFITGGNQTSGTSGLIYVGTGSTATSPGIRVDAQNTARGMYVVNAGTGDGMELNQDGNGLALDVDSESTTLAAIQIQDVPSNKSILTSTNDRFCMDGSGCAVYMVYNGSCIVAVDGTGTRCV